VETWLAEGLLDSIIADGTVEEEFVQTVKAHHCRFYQGTDDPKTAMAVQGYEQGVDGFAVWDLNPSSQELPDGWPLVSRLGHKEEVAAFAKEPPKLTTVKLKSVGGLDISHTTNRGANERKYYPSERLPLYSCG
jgi:hypothetical protein